MLGVLVYLPSSEKIRLYETFSLYTQRVEQQPMGALLPQAGPQAKLVLSLGPRATTT